MTKQEKIRKINKELNFIKSELAYMRVENPLFKEYIKKYNIYKELIKNLRKNDKAKKEL